MATAVNPFNLCPECGRQRAYNIANDALYCPNPNCRNYFYGQYRQAAAQAHSSTAQTPGPGPGASTASAAQANQQSLFQALTSPGLGQALIQQTLGIAAVPPEPESLPFAGLTVGELLGFRCWRLTEQGLLQSGYRDTVWTPGVPMCGDTSKEHEGVYAFKDLSNKLHRAAYEYSRARYTSFEDHTTLHSVAIGTVSLWGNVIEHKFGYRAEFAQVKEILGLVGVPLAEYSQRLALLRQTYCLAHTEQTKQPKRKHTDAP